MENSRQNIGHYLKFFSGEHDLLINVFNVHSIIETPELVSIVQAPTYILGVISIEGKSVPLIDTPVRLNLKKNNSVIEKSKTIVALPSGHKEQNDFLPIAFITENIDDVIMLNSDQMQPLPMVKAKYDSRLFEGVFEIDSRLMILLNIDNFYEENFDEILKTT